MNKQASAIVGGFGIAVLSVVAVSLMVSTTIPAALADPRFPQPEYHCQGNPHSDEPTGNPHDPGINDKSNPHDNVECTLNPHSPK